jgi:hypothetical protein
MDFMKTTNKLFGTHSRWLCAIALIAAITFSFTACDNGSGARRGETPDNLPPNLKVDAILGWERRNDHDDPYGTMFLGPGQTSFFYGVNRSDSRIKTSDFEWEFTNLGEPNDSLNAIPNRVKEYEWDVGDPKNKLNIEFLDDRVKITAPGRVEGKGHNQPQRIKVTATEIKTGKVYTGYVQLVTFTMTITPPDAIHFSDIVATEMISVSVYDPLDSDPSNPNRTGFWKLSSGHSWGNAAAELELIGASHDKTITIKAEKDNFSISLIYTDNETGYAVSRLVTAGQGGGA